MLTWINLEKRQLIIENGQEHIQIERYDFGLYNRDETELIWNVMKNTLKLTGDAINIQTRFCQLTGMNAIKIVTCKRHVCKFS